MRMLDMNECCKAIYSLNLFYLVYDRKNKSPEQIFGDWIKTTGFQFRSPEALKEALIFINDSVNIPLEDYIIAAECDLIPNYKDYLKYDDDELF